VIGLVTIILKPKPHERQLAIKVSYETDRVTAAGSAVSLGTMIGRIGAHEVIQHGFLGIPYEGLVGDVTQPRSGNEREGNIKQNLKSRFSGRYNINPVTAAALRSACKH
jgi:hypothetical protein